MTHRSTAESRHNLQGALQRTISVQPRPADVTPDRLYIARPSL